MSEIKDNETLTLLSGTIAIGSPSPKQGTCELCYSYTYDDYDFLHKIICENCRDKILSKIQLILDYK